MRMDGVGRVVVCVRLDGEGERSGGRWEVGERSNALYAVLKMKYSTYQMYSPFMDYLNEPTFLPIA